VIDNYKELVKQNRELGVKVLEILRHPDITDAQALDVAKRYRASYNDVKHVHESCRRVFGSDNWQYPWSNKL
jgi:hypothetical protein